MTIRCNATPPGSGQVLESQCWDRIGTPSFDGGLPALPRSGLFGLSTLPSSTLVSLYKKLLSFTGLPLDAPGTDPLLAPALLPLLALLGPGEDRWGMFSGSGCWLPMDVTPPSDALPAFESA